MEELLKWCGENYGLILAGFMLLEKIVKITPFKWDDILLDMIIGPIIKNVKHGKSAPKKVVLLLLFFILGSCSKKELIKPNTFGDPVEECNIVPKIPEPMELNIVGQVVIKEKLYLTDIVYFDFDKSYVKTKWQGVLSLLVERVANHPDCQILLEGGCCPLGTDDYNLRLGIRRADSVYDYLHTKLPNHDILVTSRGESYLVTNDSAKYNLNRNCKITVTE